jgi:Peptidase A4 family
MPGAGEEKGTARMLHSEWGRFAAACAAGCLLASTASAAARPAAETAGLLSAGRPQIVSLKASSDSGLPIPGDGSGSVTMTARVRGARQCTFLRQRSPRARLQPVVTVACASGSATAHVRVPANPSSSGRRLAFAVRARSGFGPQAMRSVTLPQQAGGGGAPVASLQVSTQTIPSSGGQIVLTYSSTGASTCVLSSAPAAWTGPNPATVSCGGGTLTATLPPVTTTTVWSFVLTVSSSSGRQDTTTVGVTQSGPAAATPPPASAGTGTQIPGIYEYSENWAGYVVDSTSTVTAVHGEWTVPSVNCSGNPDGHFAAWVGIGGDDGVSELLQTGTSSDCVGGSAVYFAWWELVPMSPNRSTVFGGLSIHPGDRMKSDVFQTSSGSWETWLDDTSTGQAGVLVTGQAWGTQPDTSTTYQSQGSAAGVIFDGATSGEWIAEVPGNPSTGGLYDLANFSAVTFTNTRLGGLSSWSLADGTRLDIATDTAVLTQTSSPGSDGASFTVTRS